MLLRATDRLLDAASGGVDVPHAAVRAAVAEIANWCAVDLLRADGRLERAASAFGPGVDPHAMSDSLVRFAIPEPGLLQRVAAARGPVRIEDPDWLPGHRAVAGSIASGGAPHGIVLALIPLGDRGLAEDLWFAGELGLRLAQVLELSAGARGSETPSESEISPVARLGTVGRPGLLLEPIASVASGEIAAGEVALSVPGGDPEVMHPVELERLPDERLAAELTAWARAEGCRVAAELEMRSLGIRIGVDVPLTDLAAKGFVTELEFTADEAGAPPGSIMLEISGVTARTLGRQGVDGLVALRNAGFLIAIDDFGTGSALPADLLETSVDVLKLSPGLVAGASHDAPRAERLGAVAELARDLGLDVVAQGVATESEMALVRELGCRWAQGEAIGKPRRLGELIERAGARV